MFSQAIEYILHVKLQSHNEEYLASSWNGEEWSMFPFVASHSCYIIDAKNMSEI